MSAITGAQGAATESRYQSVTPAPVSEWHRLLAAIKASNLPASDKAVYRLLLDKADYKSAKLSARFTPKQAQIARETSLSLRQVKYATDHLRRHGWLSVDGKTAPGRTLGYGLAAGRPCDCTGRRHAAERVQPDDSTGATFGHRTGATNGCNAAGQSTVSTERQREEGIRREAEPERERPDWPLVWRLIRTVHADPCGGIHRDVLAEKLGLPPHGRELSRAIAIAYRNKKIDCCDNYIVRPPSARETA